jgi:hypothetical protein
MGTNLDDLFPLVSGKLPCFWLQATVIVAGCICFFWSCLHISINQLLQPKAFSSCCLGQKLPAVHSASLRMPSRTKCFEDPADDFSFDSHWFCRWTLPVYSTVLFPNRPFQKLSQFHGLFAFQPNLYKNDGRLFPVT